ncbi:MAG: 60S ribosomal protein L15 [Tremellales sp. Tagirdzhanova-0007]|nr:MAG: 60S ribosomal protein L15 [Tremellales sp. Tagirdzhanova-0007]
MSSINATDVEEVAKARLSTDLGTSLGPYIVGMFFDAVLLGVCLQLFSRWYTYCSVGEKKWVKILVVFRFALFAQFLDARWSSWGFFLDNAARVPVSAFFAERAYRMMGRSALLGVVLASLLFTSISCATAAKVTSVQTAKNEATYTVILELVWITAEMTSDIITTSCIAFALWKSRTGWKATDKVIVRLLMYASQCTGDHYAYFLLPSLVAETQLPPTLVAVLFLIVTFVWPYSTWSGMFICAAKIDTICLLVVLNARYTLRHELEADSSPRLKDNMGGPSRTPGQIQVTTETFIHDDTYMVKLSDHCEDIPLQSVERLDFTDPAGRTTGLETAAMMGAYKYLAELNTKKQSDVLQFVSRVRCWEYRQLAIIHRASRPSRPDKARRLGYKAKQGYLIYRIRVRRGNRKKPVPKGATFGKPVRQGVNHLKFQRGLKSTAEERVGKRCGNLRVLNSYWINQDGVYKYYEVILVDPSHKAVRRDARINWICGPVHKHREARGLTAEGKKNRGLGKGSRHNHAPARATWRKHNTLIFSLPSLLQSLNHTNRCKKYGGSILMKADKNPWSLLTFRTSQSAKTLSGWSCVVITGDRIEGMPRSNATLYLHPFQLKPSYFPLDDQIPSYSLIMPPKFDPAEVKVIYLRATGGEIGASSALAPKIGPLGLSPKKVGEDIAKATGDWKGLRVTVQLTIQNRQAAVSVVPSASSLVIKALKEPPRDRKKEKNIKHTGNVSLDEIYNIARKMAHKSLAKNLAGGVKEILGTAQSVGCTVDGKPPHDVIEAIDEGEIVVPDE